MTRTLKIFLAFTDSFELYNPTATCLSFTYFRLAFLIKAFHLLLYFFYLFSKFCRTQIVSLLLAVKMCPKCVGYYEFWDEFTVQICKLAPFQVTKAKILKMIFSPQSQNTRSYNRICLSQFLHGLQLFQSSKPKILNHTIIFVYPSFFIDFIWQFAYPVSSWTCIFFSHQSQITHMMHVSQFLNFDICLAQFLVY